MGKAVASYAAITIALTGGLGWLLSLVFAGENDARAIWLSAIVAVVVQVAGFLAIRMLGPKQVIVGWGIAAMLRFATLVVYAVLVAKVLMLPLAPALISMAAFFFATTLIEPLLLKS